MDINSVTHKLIALKKFFLEEQGKAITEAKLHQKYINIIDNIYEEINSEKEPDITEKIGNIVPISEGDKFRKA